MTKGNTKQEREEWIHITTKRTLQKAHSTASKRSGGSKKDRRGRPKPRESISNTCSCVAQVEHQGINRTDMCEVVK